MQSLFVLLVLSLVHLFLCKACFGVAELVKIHAVRLRADLILHEVRTILGGAEAGLDRPAINRDVVDTLNGP